MKSLSAALALSLAALLPNVTHAQPIPKKPADFPQKVEFVVRWGAGGGAGSYARHFAQVVNEKLKLNVVVVNIVGAAGMNAVNYYMDQPADGSYILNMDSIFLIGALQGKTKYGVDDFTHIARVQDDTEVLCIRADDKRFSDFKGILAWAKANPNKLSISTEGAGALGDVILSRLKKMAGFTANHVPFAQFSERVTSVIGGHVDIVYEEPSDLAPYIKDGKLKPVLIFSKKKLPPPFDVATTADFGWDHDMALWRSVAVRKGTPEARARYIEEVFKYYHSTPEAKAFEQAQFLHLKQGWMPRDEMEKWVREQAKIYKEIMADVGMIK